MLMNALARGEVGNAEQWVSHHLRRWIVEGVLKGNEEINQQEIADRLGVSRSPVRDALRRLEGMGLVTINPNQRAVVTSFTLDNMREIFEMRAALEGLAAFQAARSLTKSDLIELESLSGMLQRLPDLDSYLHKHEAFHDLVALRSQMPRLRRELVRLREMATPYIRIYGSARDSAELIGEPHDALVRVLILRDPEKARVAFASHARAAFDQLAIEVLRLTEKDAGAEDSSKRERPSRRAAGDTSKTGSTQRVNRGIGGREPLRVSRSGAPRSKPASTKLE